MLDLSIIYIADLKERLPYNDSRSIKAWLARYSVEVHGGKGSKRQYIFKTPFERAVLQEKINDLMKNGNDWAKLFAAETALYERYKKLLEIQQGEQTSTIIKKENKPLGTYANKFLQDLNDLA